MTQKRQIYTCELCENLVEVLHEGAGTLVCCGQDMKLMKENAADASREKHVPVIERTDKEIKVKVGSAPHPMEEKHFIASIEIMADGRLFRAFLKPGQPPEAVFCLCFKPKTLEARAYCNLHGLWKA